MRRLIAIALFATSAQAADLAVNVGVLEVASFAPEVAHLGVYPYAGASLIFPVRGGAVIPSLAVEVSPEFGRFGLVAGVLTDVAVTDRWGVDVGLTLIHDQQGMDFSSSLFFLGMSGGASFFFGKWTLSPYVGLFGGLTVQGLAVVPGVNLAYAL